MMFFEKERGLPSSAADSLLVNGATALGSLSPDALQQQHLHIRATQPGSLSLASNASSVLSCHMQMTSANISSSLPRQHELQSGRAGSASSVQPTILRIRRRKRDDHETLDALVIEDGRQNSNRPVKRSRQTGSSHPDLASSPRLAPSKGVFRFLETVPTSAFSSEDSKRSLRDRVTSLLLHPPPRQSSSTNLAAKSPRAPTPSRSAPSGNPLLLGSGRQSKLSAPSSPSSSSRAGSLQLQEKARRHARYKIVQEKRSISSLSGQPRRNPHEQFPPTIRSTAKSSETPSTASSVTEEIKILEAAVESDSGSEGDSNDPIARKLQAYSKTRRRQDALKSQSWQSSSSSLARELSFPDDSSLRGSSQSKEEDDMMMNFVPMLQEYLSLNRPSTPETTSTPPDGSNDVSPPHPGFGSAHDLSSGDAVDSDSEWVYDVYYRDVGPSATSFPTSNDGIDIGGVGGFERIAALTGLNEDEVLLGEGEGEEESDVPNTDDEDSNEEDFYRNDYPEGDEDASEDDGGSDMSQSDDDYD